MGAEVDNLSPSSMPPAEDEELPIFSRSRSNSIHDSNDKVEAPFETIAEEGESDEENLSSTGSKSQDGETPYALARANAPVIETVYELDRGSNSEGSFASSDGVFLPPLHQPSFMSTREIKENSRRAKITKTKAAAYSDHLYPHQAISSDSFVARDKPILSPTRIPHGYHKFESSVIKQNLDHTKPIAYDRKNKLYLSTVFPSSSPSNRQEARVLWDMYHDMMKSVAMAQETKYKERQEKLNMEKEALDAKKADRLNERRQSEQARFEEEIADLQWTDNNDAAIFVEDYEPIFQVIDLTLTELVRQTTVACIERGDLLERIRCQMGEFFASVHGYLLDMRDVRGKDFTMMQKWREQRNNTLKEYRELLAKHNEMKSEMERLKQENDDMYKRVFDVNADMKEAEEALRWAQSVKDAYIERCYKLEDSVNNYRDIVEDYAKKCRDLDHELGTVKGTSYVYEKELRDMHRLSEALAAASTERRDVTTQCAEADFVVEEMRDTGDEEEVINIDFGVSEWQSLIDASDPRNDQNLLPNQIIKPRSKEWTYFIFNELIVERLFPEFDDKENIMTWKFPEWVMQFYINRYGYREEAQRQIKVLMRSIREYATGEDPPIEMFAQFLGLSDYLDKDVVNFYTAALIQFYGGSGPLIFSEKVAIDINKSKAAVKKLFPKLKKDQHVKILDRMEVVFNEKTPQGKRICEGNELVAFFVSEWRRLEKMSLARIWAVFDECGVRDHGCQSYDDFVKVVSISDTAIPRKKYISLYHRMLQSQTPDIGYVLPNLFGEHVRELKLCGFWTFEKSMYPKKAKYFESEQLVQHLREEWGLRKERCQEELKSIVEDKVRDKLANRIDVLTELLETQNPATADINALWQAFRGLISEIHLEIAKQQPISFSNIGERPDSPENSDDDDAVDGIMPEKKLNIDLDELQEKEASKKAMGESATKEDGGMSDGDEMDEDEQLLAQAMGDADLNAEVENLLTDDLDGDLAAEEAAAGQQLAF